ncbi:MAG: hypothetical protein WEA75_06725 [Acidimicrobiia bacterium]
MCDAVTVREGLLHILGGGITRMSRPEYPAQLGVALALRVMVHPTEANAPHVVEAILLAQDGDEIGRARIDFELSENATEGLTPGEELSVMLPIPLQQFPIPSADAYSFELLIDGIHQTSVPFTAAVGGPPNDEG